MVHCIFIPDQHSSKMSFINNIIRKVNMISVFKTPIVQCLNDMAKQPNTFKLPKPVSISSTPAKVDILNAFDFNSVLITSLTMDHIKTCLLYTSPSPRDS